MLGRILPDFFPKIFGKSEDQPLDGDAAQKALQDRTDDINQHAQPSQGHKSVDEVRIPSRCACHQCFRQLSKSGACILLLPCVCRKASMVVQLEATEACKFCHDLSDLQGSDNLASLHASICGHVKNGHGCPAGTYEMQQFL